MNTPPNGFPRVPAPRTPPTVPQPAVDPAAAPRGRRARPAPEAGTTPVFPPPPADPAAAPPGRHARPASASGGAPPVPPPMVDPAIPSLGRRVRPARDSGAAPADPPPAAQPAFRRPGGMPAGLVPAPTVPQPIVDPSATPSPERPDAGRPEAGPVGRGYHVPEVPDTAWTAAPSRRRAWVSRGLLFGILLIQAVLSLRLRNTVFEDEALYLYAGHLGLDHLLHGGPAHPEFARYFSGAPMVYPPLAAAVDGVAGLAGARLIGLACMIGCTGLAYAMSRLLFNERVALAAAGAFAITQSTIFLGNFATYDPPALFLLALAAWIVVRCAKERGWAAYVFAPPVMALAVAVKYAALLYVPVVVLLALLVTFRIRAAVLRLLLLPALTGGLLAGLVAWAGRDHLQALNRTTTNRATGADAPLMILRHSAEWGGALFALALFGTILYVRRPRMWEVPTPDEPDGPGRRRRLLLGALLTGTALLAPAYQMYLHTEVSLHKHIGYGLFFAAPMAGVGLTRIVGAHFRNPQLGILIWVGLLVLGMSQSQTRYAVWPDTKPMMAALTAEVTKDGHYLADDNWVAMYYLRTRTRPEQWSSTYGMTYTDDNGRQLTGEPAYQAAVAAGYFDVVELDGGSTRPFSRIAAAQLRSDPQYRLLARLPYRTSFGKGTFDVWVKNSDATKPRRPARRPRCTTTTTTGTCARRQTVDKPLG